jgi:transposase
MAKPIPDRPKRRQFTDEFRREAVQMMLDGLSASAVAERLGLADPTLLYVWKKKLVTRGDPVAGSLDERVRHLEAELLRVERERDILKKALAIFGRHA